MKNKIKNKLRQVDLLKFSFRYIKDGLLNYKDRIRVIFYNITGRKIIYAYFCRAMNFGDLFNYDVVRFMGYRLIYQNNPNKSSVAMVGSILHNFNRNFTGYILGAGFIKEEQNRIGNNWVVRILRGPLSERQCLPKNKVLYADPGILASRIFRDEIPPRYELGIIPHSSDLDKVKNYFPNDVKIINVRRHPKNVAKDIKMCRNIASSSLHGLIFADAFRIPNIHLKFGDRLQGGHHKFKDYYQGMGVDEYEYINFSKQHAPPDIISKCRLRYNNEYLTKRQDEVISVYREILPKIAE